MRIVEFLKSKIFFKHLALIIICFLGLVLIAYFLLSVYTRHGEEYILPDLTGSFVSELPEVDSLKRYDWVIMDSVYKPGKIAGEILFQDPVPGTKVKEGREIYLTVAATVPENTSMPECRQQGLKSAVSQLVSLGLKIGTLYFTTGDVSNYVIDQRFNGKPIRRGEQIRIGSTVDLVVEMNPRNNIATLPKIIGLNETNATKALWSVGMNVGKITYKGDKNSQHQRVISYSPSYGSATLGTTFDLVLMNDTERQFKKEMDKFQLEIPADTLSLEEAPVQEEDLF